LKNGGLGGEQLIFETLLNAGKRERGIGLKLRGTLTGWAREQ